jgi:hypothetical protein
MAQVLATITLALTVLGVVWRISALVKELEKIGERLKETKTDLEKLETTVSNLNTKAAILEERTPPQGTRVTRRLRFKKEDDDGDR